MKNRKWVLGLVALLVVLMTVATVVIYKGPLSEEPPAVPERPVQCPEGGHQILVSMDKIEPGEDHLLLEVFQSGSNETYIIGDKGVIALWRKGLPTEEADLKKQYALTWKRSWFDDDSTFATIALTKENDEWLKACYYEHWDKSYSSVDTSELPEHMTVMDLQAIAESMPTLYLHGEDSPEIVRDGDCSMVHYREAEVKIGGYDLLDGGPAKNFGCTIKDPSFNYHIQAVRICPTDLCEFYKVTYNFENDQIGVEGPYWNSWQAYLDPKGESIAKVEGNLVVFLAPEPAYGPEYEQAYFLLFQKKRVLYFYLTRPVE